MLGTGIIGVVIRLMVRLKFSQELVVIKVDGLLLGLWLD